jgi:RND family efflux transporter MFP subunit
MERIDRLRAPLVALSAASLLLFVGTSQAADSGPSASPKPALTVTTVRPEVQRLTQRIAANGSLAAWQEASIGAEIGGLRLAEVRVNVGDAVRAGQVLAVFASDTVQADLDQAQAAVREAEANAASATADADRARALKDSGAFSAQQVTQYLTAEQTAQARVASARAALAAQQLRLKHTQVLAPDAGVISARGATVGAVVGAGTELFRLVRQGRVEWRAEVTSTELGRIRPGTAVSVTTAAGTTLAGRVRVIAPTVDPSTRNALVYVDVAGGLAAGARPGMFSRGEFAVATSEGLTVPQQAVVVRDAFSYVFRVGPDQRVTQVKVETGRRSGDRVEIVRGLGANDTVAASGAGFLNDGDRVRVSETPPSAAAPAPASVAPPAPAK